MASYIVGHTVRSVPFDRWSEAAMQRHGQPTTPLLHAVAVPPQRYSRTGKTYRAACGAQVGVLQDGTAFPAGAERACPKCRKAVAR